MSEEGEGEGGREEGEGGEDEDGVVVGCPGFEEGEEGGAGEGRRGREGEEGWGGGGKGAEGEVFGELAHVSVGVPIIL